MSKTRLDLLLVERGLAESRAKAQALIMAGQVRVQGQVVIKPATWIDPVSQLEVDQGPRYVSRGGEKLEKAIKSFGIDVNGWVCADVGASTGGFTDCLLQHGAAKVYAVDVGKGILHWNLRNDPRVILMEETNARYVETLPEQVSLVTIDASFISLRILLPVIKKWLTSPTPSQKTDVGAPAKPAKEAQGSLVVLVKPQFEAGRRDVARGDGVIRDPEIHRQVLSEVLSFAQTLDLGLQGLTRSPLLGPKGNAEFLAWLMLSKGSIDIENAIQSVFDKGSADPG